MFKSLTVGKEEAVYQSGVACWSDVSASAATWYCRWIKSIRAEWLEPLMVEKTGVFLTSLQNPHDDALTAYCTEMKTSIEYCVYHFP